ncbi:MAG: sarcosine oxidase subunit alpha family protein [Pseudomonadota bacterium]
MRLKSGGLIDRARRLSFTFDGKRMSGHPEDTLASALLANSVRMMGRSFKYHRPRGVVTAGSDEPNALMRLRRGTSVDPNTRATTQELYDGLVAESQNAWPSLKFDALAVNDLFAPFLGAGFYYKTFMWPVAFWEKLYEPLIRRAAGLGALSGADDGEAYDTAYAHCDLLVIGAGPAGLMAALTGARAGKRVILADEDARPGGRLLAERLEVGGASGVEWVAGVIAELEVAPNVRIMPRTTVTGAYDGGVFGALERVADHLGALPEGLPRATFWRITAEHAVLAGGAHERMIAFRDNDRPGVMQAGAVRAYLNRWGVTPGRRVAVFANSDDGPRTVRDLQAAGVTVTALIDPRAVEHDLGVRTYSGAVVSQGIGRSGLRSVTVRKADGTEVAVEADCLAVSGGWNPSVHLTCHMNGRPTWREDIAAFVPTPGAVPGLVAAGAANGAFSTHGALTSGAQAAAEVLGVSPAEVPKAEDAPYDLTPFWHVAGKGRAWLDFQNDVSVKDVKLAHQENFRSVEHMKRYTTLGMATDQGKLSNIGGLAIMAELTGQSIPETGTTTFRPPYTPLPIAAMAGRHGRDHFQPHRLTPSDALSRERGASFIEAGLWHRAAWFPEPGDAGWRDACDREALRVRRSVGVADVTTLGKIDIQGPGAAEFLDRVYANMFSTLKVGRVRYGLMLREDGIVMDDGTCARLGETHYLMTTTTAAAGQVMAHLAFVSQVLWPELDVRFISVTEQWAQFAVAGPEARALLQEIIDEPITDETYPFMACGDVTVAGVQGRLFRISFSGEHAYEVAVPARYGDSLVRLLTEKAEARGGGLYGMEALNVLRIEKGFITHAEIEGRTTAFDIGMGRMVSAKKDCIGKVMSQREGLHGPHRPQLVGLEVIRPGESLRAGAHLFAQDAPVTQDSDQGHISSQCWSPTLGKRIGLGFVKDGPNRMGETIRAVDLLAEKETLCRIVPPVFHDPEGVKLRG